MPVKENFLLFIDTETGGVVPGVSPVIEVAAVLEDLAGKEIARFESKIQLEPGQLVEPGAAAVNGYQAEVWAKEARPFHEFREWLKRLIPFGSVAIAVGHNARFDRDMIDLGYYKPKKLFCPISYRVIDTQVFAMMLKLSGKIQVENIKLETVAKSLGIDNGKFHGAMADCLCARDIFMMMRTILECEDLDYLASLERFAFLRKRPLLV